MRTARDTRKLARDFAQRALRLRELLAGTGWDADRIELLVSGIWGARVLSALAGERLRASDLPSWLDRPHAAIDRAVRAAVASRAPVALTRAVAELVELAGAAPLPALQLTTESPLLHFYEPFLQAYDPARRRALGVYYTPSALAHYAVARVEDALIQELHVPAGLAEHRSWQELDAPDARARGGDWRSSQPAIVVLDPAAGAGVFLSAVIVRVHRRITAVWHARGMSQAECGAAWQAYVPQHLLPRLLGFELLPVAHALCELQLRVTLALTGYALRADDELRVTRTNALQALGALVAARPSASLAEPDAAAWLQRVSVIVGNPPYARGGAAGDDAVPELLQPYKVGLTGEKNLQPLADDYVRFLRFTQLVLQARPRAVAALVTNATFLDGHLHRAMRGSLLQSFPRIDVLDLGGSTRQQARANAARDENVFEIAQGVALTTMLRGDELGARVTYARLRGLRADKLARLAREEAVAAEAVACEPPAHYLFPVQTAPAEYTGFSALTDLFEQHSIGAKPGDDALHVAFERAAVTPRLQQARARLQRVSAVADTEAARRLRAFAPAFDEQRVIAYAYRPFDTRFVYDDPELWTRAVRRLRVQVTGEPLLLTTRFGKDAGFAHVFASEHLPDVIFLSNKSSVNTFAFSRAALRTEQASSALGRPVTRDELFAYLYAVLHSPHYRGRYASGLSRAFPRVPLAREQAVFAALVGVGERLLQLHLGHAQAHDPLVRFVDGGDRMIARSFPRTCAPRTSACSGVERASERVCVPINAGSRFEGVPLGAWELRVGAYHVCYKWLYDRMRGARALTDEDVTRYLRIVASAAETTALMAEVDRVRGTAW